MVEKRFMMVASLGFVLNWFGDSLDGTLARYRHERPNFGFIDHSIDAFSAVAIFLGLGIAGLSDFTVATFALVGYLLAMISLSEDPRHRCFCDDEYQTGRPKSG